MIYKIFLTHQNVFTLQLFLKYWIILTFQSAILFWNNGWKKSNCPFRKHPFLIQLLHLILNHFCLVFQFHLYIQDCLAGQYILFHWIYCQNSPIQARALERQYYWYNQKLEQQYICRSAMQHIFSIINVFVYQSKYWISLY